MSIIFPHKISSRILYSHFFNNCLPSLLLICRVFSLTFFSIFTVPSLCLSRRSFISLFLFVPSDHFLRFFFFSFSKWQHSTRYPLCVLLQWTFCYPVIRQMRCRTLPCWIKVGCIWRHRVLDKWETINELEHVWNYTWSTCTYGEILSISQMVERRIKRVRCVQMVTYGK